MKARPTTPRRAIKARRTIGSSGGDELQRQAIHAVAKAGRGWAVVEDVPEVAAAAPAVNFRAVHHERTIFSRLDRVGQRLIEARPAGAAIEFCRRREEGQVASGAVVGALAKLLVERA